MSNYTEFEKLYKQIPKERLNKVWFIKLRPFSKRPVEGSWIDKKMHLNQYQVKHAMLNGYNIGIVALPGGVMILDLDTDENKRILAPHEMIEELTKINTFTVLTRSKGLHYYFLNKGQINTQDIKVDGLTIGEIRSNVSYVLSPGCCVEDYSQRYEIVCDCPIQELPDTLISAFSMEKTDKLSEAKPTLKGKVGKPISEKHKKMIEMFEKKER